MAITGMGVISPIGKDMKVFQESLFNGVCGIDYITRFDTEDYKVKIAAEIKDFKMTDYVERSQARRMDLFTQYAIAAAIEAVDESGILDTVDAQRFGVYVGSGIGGMDTFVGSTEKLLKGGPRRVSPLFIPMMISNMAAGNIAIRYNAKGPCLPVVTACATSSHAIGEAFRAIRFGYADAIIAGGSEAAVNPLALAGFTNSTALSLMNDPLGSSIPFDKRRDGFVIGEGAGIIVMEEYERARKRGAGIIAEIVGYANTCDAYHITAPHPEAEGAANAIRLALDEAGYSEEMQLYYNAHGTSTPLNDKAETDALKKVLGHKKAKQIHISSTKSMTGHMLGAAGAVEVIACAVALKTGIIPPTIGYMVADPDCDLDYTPNTKKKAAVDMALSASLGFGGHNAVIAIKKGD
ncbi:MAG TPA: beta-ketoacyl-ACP synthase II [Anaerovoracaceae bacterium]|nr:beta-ketoacyl-ACP synthase II [Anaerovoracaceae bacterium]